MDLFDQRLYVGIVGSRRRDSDADFMTTLGAYARVATLAFGCWGDDVTIVSGACLEGADRFAVVIAKHFHTRLVEHPPDRTTHQGLPQPLRATKQNHDRNTLIARDSRDVLIACVAPDRTGGTEDTITKWKRLHPSVPLVLV